MTTGSENLREAGKTATASGLVGLVMLGGGWAAFGEMPKQMNRVETEVALIRRDIMHDREMESVLKTQITDRLKNAEDRLKNIAGRVADMEAALPRHLPTGREP